jgi:hypothetical protein
MRDKLIYELRAVDGVNAIKRDHKGMATFVKNVCEIRDEFVAPTKLSRAGFQRVTTIPRSTDAHNSDPVSVTA